MNKIMNINILLFLTYNMIATASASLNLIKTVEVPNKAIDKTIEDISILKCWWSCHISPSCKNIAFDDELTSSIKCYHLKYFYLNTDVDKELKILKTIQKVVVEGEKKPKEKLILFPTDSISATMSATYNTSEATTPNSDKNSITLATTEGKTTLNDRTETVETTSTTIEELTTKIEGTTREEEISTTKIATTTTKSTTNKGETTTTAVSEVTYENCTEAVTKNFHGNEEGWFYIDPDNQGRMNIKCLNETKAGNFTGSYEHPNPFNNWHYVNITKKLDGNFEWSNKQNKKWTLHPYDWNEIWHDESYPYLGTYNTYASFTTEGVYNGPVLFYKKSDLNHGSEPDVIVNHAKTLILKRGVEFGIDSLNDGSNKDGDYWIGIHNFTRLTFMKPQNLIINFVRSSGFNDFTIYRDFHITNDATFKIFFSRTTYKEGDRKTNFLQNNSTFSCEDGFTHWWACSVDMPSLLKPSLTNMQGVEVYITEIL